MSHADKIYLIGFMGSGKSTIGKKVASGLGWSFVDLDKEIEKETGLRIPGIFAKHGEEYFRKVENRILQSLKSRSGVVISTGGGAPCFFDNMDHMLKNGLTIYLKLTPGQLKQRLAASKGQRPLIKDIHRENLQDFIEEKLATREKWYKRAEIITDGMNTDYSLLITFIRKHLDR